MKHIDPGFYVLAELERCVAICPNMTAARQVVRSATRRETLHIVEVYKVNGHLKCRTREIFPRGGEHVPR